MCVKSPKRGLALRMRGDYVTGSVLGRVRGFSRVREALREFYAMVFRLDGVF